MSDREELSRRLLEENGLSGEAPCETVRDDLKDMLRRERKRGTRLASIMLWSWLVFLVLVGGMLWMAFGQHGRGIPASVGYAVFLVPALIGVAFIVAVVATIAWGLRMAFSPRGVEERLERIELQLARLEAEQEAEGDGGTAPTQGRG